ncbi:hypothetical protein [Neobacillus niacini]|uniref:hypothetical protein n=1 Tax=Neobacillus niacini TaxID=86668 RepID=UPI002FFE3905
MEKLTIFFNKRTGTIKSYCTGVQSMDFFGDEQEDYSLIFDFILVDYDPFVIQNIDNFQVIDRNLKIKQSAVPEQYL